MSFYEPLDVENYEIRLLNILPGSFRSIIRCSITKTSLINPLRYTALSYCWGDPEDTVDIVVNNIQWPVTLNLADALQQLREDGVRLLWADALCINQVDRHEKSLQIRNMRHVYERAEVTCTWIGREGDDRASNAISFLHSLPPPQEGHILGHIQHAHGSPPMARTIPLSETLNCQRCQVESQFASLSAFFRRDYWKRRWIIQELAVAAQARILCGKSWITLDQLETALNRCQASYDWRVWKVADYEYYATISALRSSYKRKDSLPLCRAIASTRQSLSRDPRDKIYALLGLSSDGAELVPTPNYQQSVTTVTTNLTRAFIWQTCSLEMILADLESRQPSSGLPSWSPDWLCAESFPQKALELAEQQLVLDRVFLPQPAVSDAHVLRVQGVDIGKVDRMARPVVREGGLRFTSLEGLPHTRSSTTSVESYYDNMTDLLGGIIHCIVPEQCVWRILSVPKPAWYALMACGLETNIRDSSRRIDRYRRRGILAKIKASFLRRGHPDSVSVHQVINHCIQAEGDHALEGEVFMAWLSQKGVSLKWTEISVDYCSCRVVFLCLICSCLPGVALLVVLTRISSTCSNRSWLKDCSIGRKVLAISSLLLGVNLIMIAGVFWLCSPRPGRDGRDVNRMKKKICRGLKSQLESGQRPMLSDMGFMGSVDPQTELGDRICFLVGCSRPVVLREVRVDDKVQYTVVGTACLYLAPPHAEKLEEFMPYTDTQRRQYLLQQKRRNGEYREFELI